MIHPVFFALVLYKIYLVITRATMIAMLGYGLCSILREGRAIWKVSESQATYFEMLRWWLYVGFGITGLSMMGLR